MYWSGQCCRVSHFLRGIQEKRKSHTKSEGSCNTLQCSSPEFKIGFVLKQMFCFETNALISFFRQQSSKLCCKFHFSETEESVPRR